MKQRVRAVLMPGLLFAALLSGCDGTGTHPAVASAAAGSATEGAALYERHCAGCHGADGRGIDERYPGLQFDQEAWADSGQIIRRVIGGSHRQMVGPAMPDHGFLGNESLAAVLTHIRNAFGPGGDPVRMEDVGSARLDLVAGFHDRAAAEESAAGPLVGLQRPAGRWQPPPMSPAAYATAQRHYEQFCTGCHGVFRTGTAGNPLHPQWMRELGTEYLRQVIGFGTARGMPTWLDAEGLTPEDVHDLALFLQHPLPPPATFDMAAIRDSWQLHRPLADRPGEPAHEHALNDMFVVALHDPGAVLIIDGASREPIVQIAVEGPPHRISASASGRYLQVVSRNGMVTLIDLYAAVPQRVASVRVGLEARSLGAARYPDQPVLLAAADWPPQFVLLDGDTLEPLQRLDSQPADTADDPEAMETSVGDIVASPRHPEFAALLRGTGAIRLLGQSPPMSVATLAAEPTLRAGSLTSDGRYLLLPTDTRVLVVLDLEQRHVVAEQPLPFAGGGSGVVYEHGNHGPVWVTGSLVSDVLAVVGVDPAGASPWTVIEEIEGPAPGSLFLATHGKSPHLWVDSPLADVGHASREVAVYRRDALGEGYRSLPIAGWADIEDGPQRVLQPTYSADGSEVWLLVWNTQDAESAIVIVDDASLTPVEVLRWPELITPMRLYSVAALVAAAAPVVKQAAAQREPDAAWIAGSTLYGHHCAACHGLYGEGDGPMSPALPVVLKDLRYLSERNEGEFPRDYVRAIIDGRSMREAHGRSGMPVWGDFFGRGEVAPEQAEASIEVLLRFLESLQR
ncbi:MAG: c-type cytochrome [Gammaproteobacteria bacterium]|nr:c-type cytochrome [Gammaproteobacteria bacterium]